MATTDDKRLEIHVFGAAKGESIVLRLPSGQWGVVDCYSGSLKDSSKNPVLKFLTDRGVDHLAFLCMTHPHDDHYRGMSHLLERCHVDYFWRPSVMTGRRLKWILKAADIDARKSGNPTRIEDARELERIFSVIKEKKNASNAPLIPKSATTGHLLYPVPVDGQAEFQVWALAPSTNQTELYEQGLAKCFDDNDRVKASLPKSNHNVVSMALLIIYGSTRIVLGGDVEAAGWIDVINEFGRDNLSSHAVKISHHGSTNGYANDLWPLFSRQQHPVTVLTSFRSKRLPQREAIEQVRKHSSRIATTCLPAIHADALAVPLSTRAPLESRLAIHQKLKATNVGSFRVGRCGFVFDDLGNCIDGSYEGDAGIIPE